MRYFLLLPLLWLSQQIAAQSAPGIPANPISCNASFCTTNANIDVCPPGSNVVVTDFHNGVFDNATQVYRFTDVALVNGQRIHATVSVDATYRAILQNIDDDAATDQAGVSIASFFAPRIQPDQNLAGTDRDGYVQFTVRFYLHVDNPVSNNDFTVPATLANLNYVHYDVDGSSTGTRWFRETGVFKDAPPLSINANSNSELVAYNYAGDGSSWRGFAGSVCERTGVSRCAEVAVAGQYGVAQSSITYRMGYNYEAGTSTASFGQPVRQFGGRFGCFEFPSQSTLPVHLLSFSGRYVGTSTLLSWTAENEDKFRQYEVERSDNGRDFEQVGSISPAGGVGITRSYSLADNLASVNGNVFFYRLKLVDLDGRFSYSPTVLIRRSSKAVSGIVINPNPVVNGNATVRMTAVAKGTVEFRVIDFTGKIVLQQKENVFEGNNSISLNNMGRLQPGVYTMQMIDGSDVVTAKFTVLK
ncbi:MAG: T9SS type A sorting domain-containing protein [Terrimonas sp.]|nr:T9SS type A sorting domain-containing protein [Terrimonas sp.]